MATQQSMNSLRTSMMFEENRWFFKKINEKSKCQRGNQWSLQKKYMVFEENQWHPKEFDEKSKRQRENQWIH